MVWWGWGWETFLAKDQTPRETTTKSRAAMCTTAWSDPWFAQAGAGGRGGQRAGTGMHTHQLCTLHRPSVVSTAAQHTGRCSVREGRDTPVPQNGTNNEGFRG